MLAIDKECRICGRTYRILVPSRGYVLWAKGLKHIQDAMPQVSADDRELLKSGICGRCFDKLFSYGD
jgi:hypothetical protein